MGIYQELYNLIQQYIYGGVELTSHMDLVATLVATAGSLFVIAIPFIVVKRFVNMLGW